MSARKLTPASFFASLFGVGFIPFAPGSFGTLLAAAVYLVLPGFLFEGWGWAWFSAALLVLCGVSVWLSGKAEKTLGHDAPAIVIDEACGFFVTVLLLPRTLPVAIYAFVLFRAFDIAKPFPVNHSQRLPGGWGITVDDLLAGLYANILIRILLHITPRFFGLA